MSAPENMACLEKHQREQQPILLQCWFNSLCLFSAQPCVTSCETWGHRDIVRGGTDSIPFFGGHLVALSTSVWLVPNELVNTGEETLQGKVTKWPCGQRSFGMTNGSGLIKVETRAWPGNHLKMWFKKELSLDQCWSDYSTKVIQLLITIYYFLK